MIKLDMYRITIMKYLTKPKLLSVLYVMLILIIKFKSLVYLFNNTEGTFTGALLFH